MGALLCFAPNPHCQLSRYNASKVACWCLNAAHRSAAQGPRFALSSVLAMRPASRRGRGSELLRLPVCFTCLHISLNTYACSIFSLAFAILPKLCTVFYHDWGLLLCGCLSTQPRSGKSSILHGRSPSDDLTGLPMPRSISGVPMVAPTGNHFLCLDQQQCNLDDDLYSAQHDSTNSMLREVLLFALHIFFLFEHTSLWFSFCKSVHFSPPLPRRLIPVDWWTSLWLFASLQFHRTLRGLFAAAYTRSGLVLVVRFCRSAPPPPI